MCTVGIPACTESLKKHLVTLQCIQLQWHDKQRYYFILLEKENGQPALRMYISIYSARKTEGGVVDREGIAVHMY